MAVLQVFHMLLRYHCQLEHLVLDYEVLIWYLVSKYYYWMAYNVMDTKVTADRVVGVLLLILLLVPLSIEVLDHVVITLTLLGMSI